MLVLLLVEVTRCLRCVLAALVMRVGIQRDFLEVSSNVLLRLHGLCGVYDILLPCLDSDASFHQQAHQYTEEGHDKQCLSKLVVTIEDGTVHAGILIDCLLIFI